MKTIVFFKEHLLVQVLTVLSALMIIIVGSMVVFSLRGQNHIVKDLLNQKYLTVFAAIEDEMDRSLSKGDNEAVRKQFQRLEDKMPDLDFLIYDSNRDISIAGNPAMEGMSLSSLIKNTKALDGLRRMMERGGNSIETFEEWEGDRHYFNTFIPLLNNSRCVDCHENSKKVLGGALVRAFYDGETSLYRMTRNKSIILGLSGLGAILLIFYFLFQRVINRPLHLLLESTGKLRSGDFTHKLKVTRRDEISHICARMNLVSDSLRGMIKEVMTTTEALATSASDLMKISKVMSSGAKQTYDMADSVTASSEGMNLNIKSVAAAIEETSTNVSMVASSAEEMTATINEIAQNSEKACRIASDAVSQAEEASINVDALGEVAREITKITETITKISEQTNLLALNATIEAARAGESGKGFAVVANEVKNLARQTAEATDDIEKQIEGIQNSTESTVQRIKGISKVINEVNEIVTSIASAVEEQSDTTREIAKSVSHASTGIQDINSNVGQSSIIAGDMTESISEVNGAAKEISNSSAHVQMSAEELSMMAEQLREAVQKFIV